MRGTAIEISHEEYRTAWHCLGLGTRHWNMDLPGLPELTEDEHRVRVGRMLDSLQTRGLANRRCLAPELEDALRLLANPLREINGSVHVGAARLRLLAGARGDRGVLAMLDKRQLVMQTGPAGELCTSVAQLLPDRPAGSGSSVSVPEELLAQPASGGKAGLTAVQLADRLVRSGIKPAEAQAFTTMIRGPKAYGGKFGAARRDRHGARHSAGAALVYLATERGGYTLQPLRGPDGSAWTTLAPATLAQVAQRLDQLLDGIRAG